MLVLFAIPIGLLAGSLLGGRLDGLSALRFRWPALVLGGLLVQVALFTPAGNAAAGAAAPAIYVGSTTAVFLAVLWNVRIPGMRAVAGGALSNLAAIIANGGAMPADPAALATAGLTAGGYTNSVVLVNPALRVLTDIFAVPSWVPLANVFSIGDVLIGIGIAITIVAAMRRPTVLPAA